MARRRVEEPAVVDVDLQWRYRWLCRAPMLVYSASTEPPPEFVEAAEVAIARLDGSGWPLAQRTAAVEELLAEHGLLEIVERRLAMLLRARARWAPSGGAHTVEPPTRGTA